MDNFIDKLAQKFIAGEVIKANSVAEERELKRLREQVAEYERCLQEMRKVQMTNTQTAKNLHDMMIECTDNFQKLTLYMIFSHSFKAPKRLKMENGNLMH